MEVDNPASFPIQMSILAIEYRHSNCYTKTVRKDTDRTKRQVCKESTIARVNVNVAGLWAPAAAALVSPIFSNVFSVIWFAVLAGKFAALVKQSAVRKARS